VGSVVDRQKHKDQLNAIAERYDSESDFDHHAITFGTSLILEHAKGPNGLELGCASGVMTKILAEHFEKLVVVDGSEYYIGDLRKNFARGNIEYYVSLFEEFETREKFNTIIMAHILEHVADPVGLLRKSRNWLGKDGAIHIIVPNATSLHRRIGKIMGLLDTLNDFSEKDRQLGHMRVYDIKTLVTHIELAGLHVELLEGIFLKPLSNEQMKGWDRRLLEAFFVVGKEMPEYCSEIYARCRPTELK
jgi:2-polyprenyl-3-methyl-5-hydroxy-6-metoxy-1,4-benzoquinol methylase